MTSSNWALVVAGGSGTRMGTETPKQFLSLAGKPVLLHALERLLLFDAHINLVVVLPENHHSTWKALCNAYEFHHPHLVVSGGSTRFQSVKNGLAAIPAAEGLVAVHDGVRPLVSTETVRRCFEAAEQCGAAVPVVPLIDSIRHIDATGSQSADRNAFCLVQTPQTFRLGALKKAYDTEESPDFTDDASVWERQGLGLATVAGNPENIKITRLFDLRVAEALMA